MGNSYRLLLSRKIRIITFLILGMLWLPAILTGQANFNNPESVVYDAPNNRLLIVSWMTNSPIQAVDINTAAVTTVTTTSYTNLDGITQDTEGYFYISSGASNAVYRYDSGFTSHSTVTTGTLDGPADIYFNTTTHNLAIPNFNSNSMTYVYIPPTGVAVHGSGIPTRFDLKQNYPNPFNPATMIEFDLPVEEMTAVRIYSALGREIVTLLHRQLHAGNHRVPWDGTDAHGWPVSTGVYFYNVVSGEYRATNKMILIR